MPQTVNVDNLKNPNGPLPLADYLVRIDKVGQDPSSKGKCMDTFECEIIAPDLVSGPDGEVMAAGRRFTVYSTYTANNLFFVKRDLAKLGITLGGNIAIPSEEEVKSGAYRRIPEIQDETQLLVGKQIGMRLSTEPRYKTDTGKWDGRPVLDETGNKVVDGYNIRASLSDVTAGPSDASVPY